MSTVPIPASIVGEVLRELGPEVLRLGRIALESRGFDLGPLPPDFRSHTKSKRAEFDEILDARERARILDQRVDTEPAPPPEFDETATRESER